MLVLMLMLVGVVIVQIHHCTWQSLEEIQKQ